MPVLETDFLKALLDPDDHLHQAALKALDRLQEERWTLCSAALLELDLLLKQLGFKIKERFEVFESLRAVIPPDRVLPLTPAVMAEAVRLQGRYRDIKDFYFDSIHLAVTHLHDRVIVSSDESFDQVAEVKWMPLNHI